MRYNRLHVLLGVDPGGTVGLATYQDGAHAALQVAQVDAVPWLRGFLRSCLDRGCTVHLGMERYVRGSAPGHHRTADGQADEVIAQVLALVDELCPGPQAREDLLVYVQGAGDAKGVCGDPVLRRLGWYRPGQRHANDASRHLGLRLLRTFPTEYHAVLQGLRVDRNVPTEA